MTTLKHPHCYAVVSTTMLYDENLTINAKYIMTILQSLPADWQYDLSDLSRISNLGREAVRSALCLLADKRYIKIIDRHIEDGRDYYNYKIYFEPYKDEEECTIIGPAKKKAPPAKKKYADRVSMTETEYNKLLDRFGASELKMWITRLSDYKVSTGKSYASDYQTIINWEKREKNRNGKPAQKKSETKETVALQVVQLSLDRFEPYWKEAQSRRGDMTKYGWTYREVYEAALLINWDNDLEFEKQQFYLRLDGLI